MAKAVKKHKGKGGGHFGRRAAKLRTGNRIWMSGRAGRHRAVHTKQKRLKTGPPGSPQGQHKNYDEKEKAEGAVCRCGSCNRGYSRNVTGSKK